MVLINDLSNNLFIFPQKAKSSSYWSRLPSSHSACCFAVWAEMDQKSFILSETRLWTPEPMVSVHASLHTQTPSDTACVQLRVSGHKHRAPDTGWGMTDVRWHKCNSLFDLWLSSAPLGYCCSLKTSHRSQLEICHSICSKMSA